MTMRIHTRNTQYKPSANIPQQSTIFNIHDVTGIHMKATFLSTAVSENQRKVNDDGAASAQSGTTLEEEEGEDVEGSLRRPRL